MAQITGPISLAAGRGPTDALKRKLATGQYQILDNTSAPQYYVNGQGRGDGSDGPVLPMKFRQSADVMKGKVGYHRKGGENLAIVIRPTATATYDSAGGTGSLIFIQEAIFDSETGEKVDDRIHEYADFNTDLATGGMAADPVLSAGRDNVAYITSPLPPNTYGVVHGLAQVDLDTA